jgi:hypothetical protein
VKKKTFPHSTILIIVLGLLVLSFLFKAPVLVTIATVVGVISMIFPPVAFGVEWIWLKLAETLGWINSRLLLGIVFFVFLSPIALLHRLFHKNPLQLKKTNGSIFVAREHAYTEKDFENMW